MIKFFVCTFSSYFISKKCKFHRIVEKILWIFKYWKLSKILENSRKIQEVKKIRKQNPKKKILYKTQKKKVKKQNPKKGKS